MSKPNDWCAVCGAYLATSQLPKHMKEVHGRLILDRDFNAQRTNRERLARQYDPEC